MNQPVAIPQEYHHEDFNRAYHDALVDLVFPVSVN